MTHGLYLPLEPRSYHAPAEHFSFRAERMDWTDRSITVRTADGRVFCLAIAAQIEVTPDADSTHHVIIDMPRDQAVSEGIIP